VVIEFSEYDEIVAAKEARRNQIDKAADRSLNDNMEALKELAK